MTIRDQCELRSQLASGAPRLLMYMDLFGRSLEVLMAPQFSEATFIDHLSSYPDLLSYEEVNVVDPDVVVLQFVERNLPYLNAWLEQFVSGLK